MFEIKKQCCKGLKPGESIPVAASAGELSEKITIGVSLWKRMPTHW